jgi:cell division protein FtsX
MYLLRLALRPWRAAAMSQTISAIAVGFLLCLCGFLFWLQSGLGPIVGRMQTDQVITAYLSPELEEREQGAVIDSIRVSLGAHSAEVRLMNPAQFLSGIKPNFPELVRELEDLGNEAQTVVPRFVSISGQLPADSVERVKRVKGVESAETSRDKLKQIIGAFQALRWIAGLLAGGLCLALLAGLVHLARLNSQLQSDATSLLRLWGASEMVLRLPSALSGASVGIAGGLIGATGWVFWGSWLVRHVRSLSPLLHEIQPGSASGIALLLLFGGALIGAVSGLFGSLPSASEA